MQTIPKWAKRYFSQEMSQSLSDEIARIENSTRGEIVVMVAESSSTTGHVPFSLFVTLLLLFALCDLPYLMGTLETPFYWHLWMPPLLALIFTRVLSPLPWVQRMFLPKTDAQSQVQMRAEAEFYRHGLQKTEEATGILVYVSLFERQAVLLGGKSIDAKLPPDTWSKILGDLIVEARKGNLDKGLMAALKDLSPILTEHFPAHTHNPNELPNHLIFVEA